MQPLIFLSLYIHFPFFEFQINGIMHHVLFFLAMLLLLKIIILRFIPVVACVDNITLIVKQYSMYYVSQFLYVLIC